MGKSCKGTLVIGGLFIRVVLVGIAPSQGPSVYPETIAFEYKRQKISK